MINIYPWQEVIWQRLAPRNQVSAQGGGLFASHAFLLRGKKGLGKFAFARYLAKSRLCENRSVEGGACGICASCRWFEQGSHPDFRLVEPEALSAAPSITGSSDDRGDDSGANAEADAEAIAAAGTETGSAKSRRKPSKQIGVEQILVVRREVEDSCSK